MSRVTQLGFGRIARISLFAGVTLALGACAGSQDDGQSNDSALSFGDLTNLVTTFNGIQARRPMGPLDGFAKLVAVPDAKATCGNATDEVCTNLVTAESQAPADARITYDQIRAELKSRVQNHGATPIGQVVADNAFRYWVRERVAALTAYYGIHDDSVTVSAGTSIPTEPTSANVDAFLKRYYPLYTSPSDMALTRAILPPADVSSVCSDGKKTDAVIIIPGVLRTEIRKEFNDQIDAVSAQLPCIDIRRVEFGSFDDPDTRIVPAVQQLVAAIDQEDGKLPLHIVGYSQGVVSAVRTLAEDPAIGARTRSVLAMNGAHHGSEAADFALQMVDAVNACGAGNPACGLLQSQAIKILSETFFQVSLSADSGSTPLPDFLAQKRAGMESLTTPYAQKFWAGPAANIPKNAPNALFYTHRSGITRTDKDPAVGNLPDGQVALYNIIFDKGGAAPWNDMQVRVANHALGGPVAPREIVARVAEGNHWMWQLKKDETLPNLDPKMGDRTPRTSLFRAYFETLAEVGLIGPQR